MTENNQPVLGIADAHEAIKKERMERDIISDVHDFGPRKRESYSHLKDAVIEKIREQRMLDSLTNTE